MRTLLTTLALALFASTLFAQGIKLNPYNVEFAQEVNLSVIDWNGRPALLAIWDYTNSMWVSGPLPSSRSVNAFVQFHDQPTHNLALNIEAAGFIFSTLFWGSGPVQGCPPTIGSDQVWPPRYVRSWGSSLAWTTGLPNPYFNFTPGGRLEYSPPVTAFEIGFRDNGACGYFPCNCTGLFFEPSAPDWKAIVFTIEVL